MDIKASYFASLVLAWAVISPAVAQANEVVAPITVGDLDAIMQEEIILKAKANREKQRAELGRYDSPAGAASVGSRSLPQLAWRRSTASGWLAKFVLADGASLIASKGEHLPGGYVVAQIDDNGVKLERNGELVELTAAVSGARSTEPTSQPSNGGASTFLPTFQ